MKTLVSILFVCCGLTACADDTGRKPLHMRIKDAVDAGTEISFESKDGLRKISVLDAERQTGPSDVRPLMLQITNVIWRRESPNARQKITLEEARSIYSKFSSFMEKQGGKPKLELWISEYTDEKLVTDVFEALCPTGKSTVSIRYFGSYPQKGDPEFVYPLVVPRLPFNPAQQPGTGQPATRPVVEPENSDKPQPEAEGRSR